MTGRTYELIYILVPEATEQQVADLQAQVAGIVERMGGTIEKTDPWGRRKLAYEIGKHKEGFYVLHVINGSGELMKEIDRRLKVTDDLLRHLIVRVDERQEVADRARTKRQETSRRRRVARGLPPDRQPGEGPQQEGDEDGDQTYESTEGEA
ncbi:MAG: 30S ribosomal protein S6 [Vicinamibacterales bacterium]